MAHKLTPERIAELKKRLAEHPIDHKWDDAYETLDAYIHTEDIQNKTAYEHIQLKEELPE